MEWFKTRKRKYNRDVEKAFGEWKEVKERREAREEREKEERRRGQTRHLEKILEQLLVCVCTVAKESPVYVVQGSAEVGARECWKVNRRQNNFQELFENTPEDVFKRRMRMNKESFSTLLSLVHADLAPSRLARGDFMSPRRTLSLTLLRLAHGTTFLELCQQFAIGMSTAHSCYKKGIRALCRLQEQFIQVPKTSADVQGCIESFASRGFPNACLAVDGCHVKVELADQYLGLQDFICYKGFYSLNNIAYVDGKGLFRAVLCGWAGSSADGGVVREMEFTKSLQVRMTNTLSQSHIVLTYHPYLSLLL